MFRQMNVVEERLTKRVQEVNDDTKTLIHHVGVLQGRAGLTASGDEPEAPGTTAAG